MTGGRQAASPAIDPGRLGSLQLCRRFLRARHEGDSIRHAEILRIDGAEAAAEAARALNQAQGQAAAQADAAAEARARADAEEATRAALDKNAVVLTEIATVIRERMPRS